MSTINSLISGATELKNLLSQIIRVGEVASINAGEHTARVVFPEEDNAVSYDLAILARNSLNNKDYQMPDVGEDVLCLFLPDGMENGFILGSFYAQEVTRPTSSAAERKVTFADGTFAVYNREAHTLNIEIEGTKIHADRQQITITTTDAVTVQTKAASVTCQSAKIAASQGIALTGDTISLRADSSITLNAPLVSVN